MASLVFEDQFLSHTPSEEFWTLIATSDVMEKIVLMAEQKSAHIQKTAIEGLTTLARYSEV